MPGITISLAKVLRNTTYSAIQSNKLLNKPKTKVSLYYFGLRTTFTTDYNEKFWSAESLLTMEE